MCFGIGRRNRADDAPVDHPLFEDAAWDAVPAQASRDALRDKARAQLGTVGSGNHYVDVFADETGAIWVGVHFGSRGFGHTVASDFLALRRAKEWGERAPEREVLLDLAAPMGHDYWHLMNLAGGTPTPVASGSRAKSCDPRRHRAGSRPQPPQLRLARDARRART